MSSLTAELLPELSDRHAEENSRQNQLTDRIATVTAAAIGVSAIVFWLTVLHHRVWQVYLLALTFTFGFLVAMVIAVFAAKHLKSSKVLWLAPAAVIPLIVLAALVKNLALIVALVCFLYGTILATGGLQGRSRDAAISLSFFSALLTSLLGTFSPVAQVRIPALEIYLPSALSILLMIYVVLLSMDYVTANLRIKLLTISLAIAVLPLIILSMIDSRFIQNSLKEQTNQALRLAAEETATSVESFLVSMRDLTTRQAENSIFYQYLSLEADQRRGSDEEKAIQLTLDSLALQQPYYFRSIGVLDMDGLIVYDTSPLEIGRNERLMDYFSLTASTGQAKISSVEFSEDGTEGYLYFSSSIKDPRQKIIGILRIKYDALVLQTLLEEKVNLVGARSYPILLDENYLRLADTLMPNTIYRLLAPLPSTSISQLIRHQRLPDIPIYMMSTGHEALGFLIDNYLTNPYFSVELHEEKASHPETGYVTRLTSMPWYLVFVTEQTSLEALVRSQGKTSTLIATLIAGVVGVFATGISANFSRPIIRLHATAEKIISGDLDAQADVESSDEIGSLAGAFNNMTHQLKTLINELENRVLERTKELASQNEALTFRGRQLQTVSDVARSIISTREFEGLLTQVTTLVSERFNFYHVAVFLLDPKGEYAVLRAANSEGGKRMLARQHKLKVGAVGIVGYVTATGEPRIATDVGKDAVYFNNPDLPLTRSEMALPLKSNDRIIGALDVQSTEADAFTQEDIELFSTLADQISIAIVNNQLFNETVKALEEAQQIHRQYLRREWTSEITARQVRAFKYSSQGAEPQAGTSLPEIQRVLETGQPVVQPSGESGHPAVLAVPIKLRGETLGVIHLKDASMPDRTWNEDEVTAISAVADQVALALENARLLEKTIRRSERDRKALEITGKIRSTNDTKSMVEIALEELRQTLKATRVQIILKENGGDESNGRSRLLAATNTVQTHRE